MPMPNNRSQAFDLWVVPARELLICGASRTTFARR
jgi:hypothetical protein